MKRYIAVIDQQENSAYGMWFPDLPGCYSASDDADGIVRNAIEAIGLYLEVQASLPEARTLSEISSDLEVQEAIRNGALLQAIPFVGPLSETKKRINITIDAAMIDAIDSAATERGLSRSAFIQEAARREVER